MEWESLNEAVPVRADFQAGTVSPVVFRRGRNYVRVRKVNTRWQEPNGRSRKWYFSVTAESGDLYQLCFDTGDLTWRVQFVRIQSELP